MEFEAFVPKDFVPKDYIQSTIDHKTTDLFDLSAEELRCFSRDYYDSDDAVAICFPDGSEKAFSYTEPTLTDQHQASPRRFGMTIQRLFINPPCTSHPDDHVVYRDVLHPRDDVVFEDEFDTTIAIVARYNRDDDDSDMERSVVSSVGSNDYCAYSDIEDDACSAVANTSMVDHCSTVRSSTSCTCA